MKIFESTTFQFCFMVLVVAGLAAAFGDLEWKTWLEQSIYLIGIYAGKEGIRYGASAYEGKGK